MENKEQLQLFLKEGEDWFKNQHFPKAFPAFVAQIPDSIKELSKNITEQSLSNEKLSNSIKIATWVLATVAIVTLVWDIIKTLYIK